MDDPYTPERALEELDFWCGALYDIWIQGAGFAARGRVDGTGQIVEGATPEELDAAIQADLELAHDKAAQAALRAYEARGIDVVWTGFWQAIINEDLGHAIISRDGLPQLLGRLAELDAAGVLPGLPCDERALADPGHDEPALAQLPHRTADRLVPDAPLVGQVPLGG
jgi:hypothetical protein